MNKCGNKFCSDPSVNSESDVEKCKAFMIKTRPNWKGPCFFQRQGAGCQECGGKLIRGSGCSHCIVCGWSKCG